ncbi:hypothetical protein ACP70R_016075 [Stipagrostis hirtigluma subsp. patula]
MDHHDESGASRPWAELPADVLREIAGRHLRDATDFVRFHAVCRPWRDAAPPDGRAPSLLPWLVARHGWSASARMRFRSPIARRSMHLPHLPGNRDRRLIFSDAAAGRVLAAGARGHNRSATIVFNPLTGDTAAAAAHPPPRREVSSWGCTSRGKDIFSIVAADHRFWAVMRPGEPFPGATRAMAANLPPPPPGRDNRYVLECHGELLCVDVLDVLPCQRQAAPDAPAALMSVHARQESGDGRPRWVARELGRSDAHRHLCLFLGWESSFAVDAREFAGAGMTGGCAYFIGRRKAGKEVHGVYRYSFEDGTVTLVDELPARFDRKSMWFMPRPKLSAVRAQH